MDAPALAKAVRIKRWLPYWAVFQADLRQTMRSWVYLFCILIALLAAVGYLLYRIGVYREAGIVQPASSLVSDLLRWSVFGGVGLVIIVTAGCISAERGILADSVLSRGISRYQYFLGKWHARLVVVMGTFLAMGTVAVSLSYLLLHGDMSIIGSLAALAIVMALLALVATIGVTVSAVCNSTLLGIAVLWIALYGAGFAMSFLPSDYPTPDRTLTNLPFVLRGAYDFRPIGRMIGYSALGSLCAALVGLGYFSRRDV
jgi:hypothetical protein